MDRQNVPNWIVDGVSKGKKKWNPEGTQHINNKEHGHSNIFQSQKSHQQLRQLRTDPSARTVCLEHQSHTFLICLNKLERRNSKARERSSKEGHPPLLSLFQKESGLEKTKEEQNEKRWITIDEFKLEERNGNIYLWDMHGLFSLN